MKTEQIDEVIARQRELIRESEIEVLKCKQALEIAESVRAGRLGALVKLVELKKAEPKNPNVHPNGRYASIEQGGV